MTFTSFEENMHTARKVSNTPYALGTIIASQVVVLNEDSVVVTQHKRM